MKSIICLTLVYIGLTQQLPTKYESWIIVGNSVPIRRDSDGKAKNDSTIPQGSFVLISPSASTNERIYVAYPYVGYLEIVNDLGHVQARKLQPSDIINDPQAYYVGNGLLKRNGESLDWVTQWPVGTGKTGVLVGGSFSDELAPLSLSDLYVKKRVNPTKKNVKKAFFDARSAMIKNEPQRAHQLISGTEVSIADSHFEYAADLTLCFSSSPFLETKLPSFSKTIESTSKDNDMRSQTLEAMKKVFPPCGKGKRDKSHHVSFLDTVTGKTKTLIVTSDGTLHRREWLGSSQRDVLIGKFDCVTATDTRDCINVALRLSRQGGYHSPDVQVRRYNGEPTDPVSSGITVQRLELTLSPSNVAVNPHLYVCFALVCHDGLPDKWTRDTKDTVVCNGASKAEVLVSAALGRVSVSLIHR